MSASEHMASKLQSRSLQSNGSTSPRLTPAGSHGRGSRGRARAGSGKLGTEASTPSCDTEDIRSLRAENEELRQENQLLKAALATKDSAQGGVAACSEARLRSALADSSTTGEQLRQAIAGAEALIEEAKRELAAKDHRAKRAAFEQLHAAAVSMDEMQLAVAVTNARFAQVDEHDIQQAEQKLAELKAMTPEERAAKLAKEMEMMKKKEAFLLVKRDDAEALQELLDELEEGTKWQDWRDYAGRTLRRFAQDLRAARSLAMLGERLGIQVAPAPPPVVAAAAVAADPEPVLPAAAVEKQLPDPGAGHFPVGPSSPDTPQNKSPKKVTRSKTAPGLFDEDDLAGQSPVSQDSTSSLDPADEERLKSRALKAVAQDDPVALHAVLKLTPTKIMASWQNKAGKDLLALCEERGSSSAYSVLAKALGVVREMKRETYEEREAVWVFVQGDVQPRRATVLEDTPAEADTVLLEFWDSEAPAEHVERCLVRRMWS